MPLPFEQDALALLEACAMALLPLNAPAQGQAVRHAAPFGEAPHGTQWQRTPGGSAIVTKAAQVSAQLQPATPSFVTLPPQTTTLSAEQLSKTIERDARRFD